MKFAEGDPQPGKLEDSGHKHAIRGMIWHQGESDAGLTAFLDRVRTDLGTPDLPFEFGEVYDNGKRDAVRAAQKETAEKVKGACFVFADKLTTFDDGTGGGGDYLRPGTFGVDNPVAD